jgi:hypothetical protein
MALRPASRKILRQQRQQLIDETRDKVIAQLMLLRLQGKDSEWVKKALTAVEQVTCYGVLAKVLVDFENITTTTSDKFSAMAIFITQYQAYLSIELALGLRAAKHGVFRLIDDETDHPPDPGKHVRNTRSSPPQAQNSRPPKKLVR